MRKHTGASGERDGEQTDVMARNGDASQWRSQLTYS